MRFADPSGHAASKNNGGKASAPAAKPAAPAAKPAAPAAKPAAPAAKPAAPAPVKPQTQQPAATPSTPPKLNADQQKRLDQAIAECNNATTFDAKAAAIKKESAIWAEAAKAQSKGGAMNPSDDLVSFLTQYEGYKDKPYRGADSQNQTIGIGHVIKPNEKFDVPMSRETAKEIMLNDLNSAVNQVNKCTKGLNLSQNQFDALVDFAYNKGNGAFAGSTLLKDIKAGKDSSIIEADFKAWRNANHSPCTGVYRRSSDEWEMWDAADYTRDYPSMPK